MHGDAGGGLIRARTPAGLDRTVVIVELTAIVLLRLASWLSFRQQDLRWQAQRAITRWAKDVHPRPRRHRRRAGP